MNDDPYATHAPPVEDPYKSTDEEAERIRAEVAEQTGIPIAALTGSTRHEIEHAAAQVANWKYYGPNERTVRDHAPASLRDQFRADKRNHKSQRASAVGEFMYALATPRFPTLGTIVNDTDATPFG